MEQKPFIIFYYISVCPFWLFICINHLLWHQVMVFSWHWSGSRSQVWSTENENQHLHVWGHGPKQEKDGVSTPVLGLVTAPSGGVEVSWGLVHEWKERGARDQEMDWDHRSLCMLSVMVKRELDLPVKLNGHCLLVSFSVSHCGWHSRTWSLQTTERLSLR